MLHRSNSPPSPTSPVHCQTLPPQSGAPANVSKIGLFGAGAPAGRYLPAEGTEDRPSADPRTGDLQLVVLALVVLLLFLLLLSLLRTTHSREDTQKQRDDLHFGEMNKRKTAGTFNEMTSWQAVDDQTAGGKMTLRLLSAAAN